MCPPSAFAVCALLCPWPVVARATKELVRSVEAAAEAFQWPWGSLSRVRAEGKGAATVSASAAGSAKKWGAAGTLWERQVRAVDASGFSLLSLWRPDLGILRLQQEAAGTGAGTGVKVGAAIKGALFSEREHGFFVRSSAEMSPLLYRYLRSYALSYADFRGEGDPDIFGINTLDISPSPKAQVISP